MKKRGRPAEFDRTAALDQAMNLFWHRGFEGTSLNDLTSAMGIRPPSLYAAFGSKERLFIEAIDRYATIEGGAGSTALTSIAPTRAAIAAMLRANVNAYTMPGKPTGCMIMLAAVNTTSANERVRQALTSRRADSERAIVARIQRGQAEGDVPATTDANALAGYTMAITQGLALRARDGASRAELLTIITAAMAGWDALAGVTNAIE